jgi:hypothetical protein
MRWNAGQARLAAGLHCGEKARRLVVPGEDEAGAPLVGLAAAKIGATRLIDNLEFQANKENMQRTLLKSTIHRATVTHCELHYEGSCAVDEDLLDAANLMENEQIDICDVNNGYRLTTHVIKRRGERGIGMISLDGSAARVRNCAIR